jgi:ribosomal protein S18 acetylase RimI-like enzyme
MGTNFDPSTEALPSAIRPLLETDRRELVRFLGRDPEENIYLLSRVANDGVVNEGSASHGRFYGHFGPSALDGVIFFGHRKGVVLAGEDPEFMRAAASLALGKESDWIILVGPRRATDGFLSHYRWRGRPTHINRVQIHYVLRPEDALSAPVDGARRAEPEDLEAVVGMSEQMLIEDFRLPPGSLSREGIRLSMQQKIQDGRTWVVEAGGEIVFKADVSARFSGGAQIEGVFTRSHCRGRGYAVRGLTAITADLLRSSAFVSLHVAQDNAAARRAYEKCGFRPFSELRLVLLNLAQE